MKENGEMTRHMVEADIPMPMEQLMMENGLMINNKEEVWSIGQMELTMKEFSQTVRKKALANCVLLMVLFTKENSTKMRLVAWELTNGQMGRCM